MFPERGDALAFGGTGQTLPMGGAPSLEAALYGLEADPLLQYPPWETVPNPKGGWVPDITLGPWLREWVSDCLVLVPTTRRGTTRPQLLKAFQQSMGSAFYRSADGLALALRALGVPLSRANYPAFAVRLRECDAEAAERYRLHRERGDAAWLARGWLSIEELDRRAYRARQERTVQEGRAYAALDPQGWATLRMQSECEDGVFWTAAPEGAGGWMPAHPLARGGNAAASPVSVDHSPIQDWADPETRRMLDRVKVWKTWTAHLPKTEAWPIQVHGRRCLANTGSMAEADFVVRSYIADAELRLGAHGAAEAAVKRARMH